MSMDNSEDLIRDRLVLGVNDESVRRRLLRKKDITLASALDNCRVAEMTDMRTNAITQDLSLETLNSTDGHCRHCGTANHFAKVCMKRGQDMQQLHAADTGVPEDAGRLIHGHIHCGEHRDGSGTR